MENARERERGSRERRDWRRFLRVGVWQGNKRNGRLLDPLVHEKLLGFHVKTYSLFIKEKKNFLTTKKVKVKFVLVLTIKKFTDVSYFKLLKKRSGNHFFRMDC